MKSESILMILITVLLTLILMLSWSLLVEDTEDFRKSSEGKCLTKIAKGYCFDEEMLFVKIYSPWYDNSFACNDERGRRDKEFSFTTKELKGCA